jgi:dihydroorotate dehydrogenase subfamily 2
MGIYNIIRPLVFSATPDQAHKGLLFWGKLLSPISWIFRPLFSYSNKKLNVNVMTVNFPNPVGLGAGFDKNAELTRFLPAFGFGHLETGSITYGAYKGNKPPHATRLVKDNSIVINYGLKNLGAVRVLKNLKKKSPVPIGVSIAATNKEYNSQKEMAQEFLKAYHVLKNEGDYITLNVSCPNAFGGENFCQPENLNTLLDLFRTENVNKPLFVKLKVDLTEKEVDEILQVVKKYNFVTGFIVGNLTKKRENLKTLKIPEQGGLSGRPCYQKALNLVRYIHKKEPDYVLIGLGGIFSVEDAIEMLKSGATMVQLITGMIYQGPGLMKKINKGIIHKLNKEGFASLEEALKVWHG